MKRYYYFDNWTGRKHEFATLRDAKKAALSETGEGVWIRDVKTGKRIFSKASGHVPA